MEGFGLPKWQVSLPSGHTIVFVFSFGMLVCGVRLCPNSLPARFSDGDTHTIKSCMKYRNSSHFSQGNIRITVQQGSDALSVWPHHLFFFFFWKLSAPSCRAANVPRAFTRPHVHVDLVQSRMFRHFWCHLEKRTARPIAQICSLQTSIFAATLDRALDA